MLCTEIQSSLGFLIFQRRESAPHCLDLFAIVSPVRVQIFKPPAADNALYLLSDLALVLHAPINLGANILVGRDELSVEISEASQLVKEKLNFGECDLVTGTASM